jgi:hypothetical protein
MCLMCAFSWSRDHADIAVKLSVCSVPVSNAELALALADA